MSTLTLPDIAKKMRAIDITMLSTYAENGAIAGRPMSNNADVDYAGDSYYFTWEKSHMVEDIKRNPQVSLAFQDNGNTSFQIAVEGEAELIHDKAAFKDHWKPEFDKWFEKGIDTEGVVMIKVQASRIHYWDGKNDGEIKLKA
ncbi:MAG: pyridoxamine 5'-phosphate oxidase family protein [Pseudomonadota bacterium]